MDLLAVGRLEHQKGFDVLLRAMAEVTVERPGDVALTIVGGGSQHGALREMIERCDLSEAVTLIGPVPVGQVMGYYERCDAVALPARFDAASLVLHEAWRAGRAVIATKAGAVPATATDRVDALLVDVDDPVGLAKAIVALADDVGLRTRLAEAGRAAWASLPTWADTCDRYDEIYAEVRSEQRAPTPVQRGRRR